MSKVNSEGKVVSVKTVPSTFKLFDNDAIIKETSSGGKNVNLNIDSCTYEFSQN